MRIKHSKRACLACIWFVILMMSVTACSMPSDKTSEKEPEQSAGLTPEAVSEVRPEKSGEDMSVETEAAVSKSSGSPESMKDAQPESGQSAEARTEEALPEGTLAEEPAAEDPEPAESQPDDTPSEEDTPAETGLPLIVSFIDDDTTNNEYIRRYHDACVKNGITGNYAIITSHLTEGVTSADTLLSYQEQGFGMLAHCNRQTGSQYWRGEDRSRSPEELEECRQDLLECRDVMESYGFVDSLLWVSPFGIHDEDIQAVAQEAGMECLFSIGTDGINTTEDRDRWNIRRFSLTADDTTEGKTLEDAKARIDQCAGQGSGWLIITTHFNTWGDLYWDETPDENGNAAGYERFNEIVQYALAAGMTPMTIQEAFRNYYEPILEANSNGYEDTDDIG